MARVCDYTGKLYEGTGIIVSTTDGQQVMSPIGFGQFVRECMAQAEKVPADQEPVFGQPETTTPQVDTFEPEQITPPVVPVDPAVSEPSATDGTSPEPEGPTNV